MEPTHDSHFLSLPLQSAPVNVRLNTVLGALGKFVLTLSFVILSAPVFAESCGGSWGIRGHNVKISRDMCGNEAKHVIGKLIDGDYSTRKNYRIEDGDLNKIFYLHYQKNKTYYCGIKGYLVITNMVIPDEFSPKNAGTRTAICLRKKRHGKIQLFRVDREIDKWIIP